METELVNSKGWEVLSREVEGGLFIIAYDEIGNSIGYCFVDNLASIVLDMHCLSDYHVKRPVSVFDLFF